MDRLYCDMIDSQPLHFDFSADTIDDAEDGGWSIVEPSFDEWTIDELKIFLDDEDVDYADITSDYLDELNLLVDQDEVGVEKSLSSLRAWLDSNDVDTTDEDEQYIKKLAEKAGAVWESKINGFSYMNYLYPLGENYDTDMVGKLDCMVVVEYDGKNWLALTGGGMDMTGYICKAYIQLGYYPPLRFCELRSGDREPDFVVAACKRSAEIAMGWAKQTLEDLDNRYPHIPMRSME